MIQPILSANHGLIFLIFLGYIPLYLLFDSFLKAVEDQCAGYRSKHCQKLQCGHSNRCVTRDGECCQHISRTSESPCLSDVCCILTTHSLTLLKLHTHCHHCPHCAQQQCAHLRVCCPPPAVSAVLEDSFTQLLLLTTTNYYY